MFSSLGFTVLIVMRQRHYARNKLISLKGVILVEPAYYGFKGRVPSATQAVNRQDFKINFNKPPASDIAIFHTNCRLLS
jgi:hypothetical protein